MKTQSCSKTKPHSEHIHRDDLFFWFRKLRCPGVKERPKTCRETWEAANPAIGIRISEEFWNNPVVHKHHLMLTKWNWPGMAPWGQYDQICKITFTCTDDSCDFEHTLYRWEYDALVLGPNRTKVYGTWPT